MVVWAYHCAVAALCIANAHAALSQSVPIWATFTSENSDLPSNFVTGLEFGSDGALWVGTLGGGLTRLDRDGRWRVYNKSSSKGSLPDDRVTALMPTTDGALWIGTDGGGLARLDRDGRWRTYDKASSNGGLPSNNVRVLAHSSDGALWVGTYSGLARLDRGGQWRTYGAASLNGGLPVDNSYVTGLVSDPDDALWVGFDGGGGALARLDRDGRWRTYDKASSNGGLPSNNVRVLAHSSDGALWVGTVRGLARLDRGGQWRTYNKASSDVGLPDDHITALAVGPDGALWVGTYSGLARLDRRGEWRTYNRASSDGGLPNDRVTALAVGPDGALWIGTSGGLARLDQDGQWQVYSKTSGDGGLPDNSVRALAVGQDGMLWAGTDDGLVRRDRDGRWRTYMRSSGPGALTGNIINALATDPDGALWVGTHDYGVVRLRQDDRWQVYSEASSNGGLPYDRVTALVRAPDGVLWIGTNDHGLARLDQNGQWRTYNKASSNGGLPDNDVRALATGPDGALWVGTSRGLARLGRDGQWRTYNEATSNGGLPNDHVWALATGPDGALWVGTLGGLARFDRNGQWRTYKKLSGYDGLPGNDVRALAPSSDGALWVGTLDGGLARLDRAGHWQAYNKANTSGGLLDDHIRALAIDPDGALWVGTSDVGLSKFKPPADGLVRIVDVIGKVNQVIQAEQTIAVVAFDESYLTRSWMFQYVWELTERGLLADGPKSEIKTRSTIYNTNFDHDGTYRLRVVAVDRYGNHSEPKDVEFKVVLRKPQLLVDTLLSHWPVIISGAAVFYAIAFISLLFIARYRAWAFRILSDAVWASWLTWPFFFLRHLPRVQRWILEPWFKAVRDSISANVQFLDPPISKGHGAQSEGTVLLRRLCKCPRLWLHGRSGMGKSSVFAAWERGYYAVQDIPNLKAAIRRYGFILITIPLRNYATLPIPDTNHPESWILEIVRLRLEQFDFFTHDLGLIKAMLKAGHIALALDGTNEVDRDPSLAAFASLFSRTKLLVTSQALPQGMAGDTKWCVWQLPCNIGELRAGLLELWLGHEKATVLTHRIETEGLSATTLSGYDLRLLADLAVLDSGSGNLPGNRKALYRMMLARAEGPDGRALPLEGLKQLAWTMVTQRRRRITQNDAHLLSAASLRALAREGLRIVWPIGADYEFRHDQMRAFLAALWLVEETPTIPVLERTVTEAKAFDLNSRDQEELWGFVAPLLNSSSDLEAMWNFSNGNPMERAILLAALQYEADERDLTLVRVAQH